MKSILLFALVTYGMNFSAQAQSFSDLQQCKVSCSPRCADLARQAQVLARDVLSDCSSQGGGGGPGHGPGGGQGQCVSLVQEACSKEYSSGCYNSATNLCKGADRHYGQCVNRVMHTCKKEYGSGCFNSVTNLCKNKRPNYSSCVATTFDSCKKEYSSGCFNSATNTCAN